MTSEPDIIIVHTGETSVRQWNPLTHEETHEELPDGNMWTIIRPKPDTSESTRNV